jgi:hypothetical protein
MGKIGFSCQLSLSEIGLTAYSAHSTWFHKTTRFYRSKSSRFYMKKIWLSVFYSIRVGEEPDPLLLKKIEETEPSQDDTDQPLCAKDTTISEGTGVPSLFHFHSRVLMCFHAPLRPRKMDKFLFLGTHKGFVTTKRITVTPPLTTSFMKFIVIEIHVLPRQNL